MIKWSEGTKMWTLAIKFSDNCRNSLLLYFVNLYLCKNVGFYSKGYCWERPPSSMGPGVKTNAKGGADAQLGEKQWMWHHLASWKSHDVVPNASFTRHDISHCSIDVAVITELCIRAAYRLSSSGSSLVTVSQIIRKKNFIWGRKQAFKFLPGHYQKKKFYLGKKAGL
jgi:hypothetical protein